ncbi:uncharacterized protein LOC141612624 [Silene latifolia]|uniref:uncharacterized protein LOC141612624 n=1 Tax=Silene latifolia TaxID=37657 RepID=UPI003D77730A
MASKFTNLFDLLGGNESDDDVTDLYERMKKKADEEVPSSPPKTRKEYIVFAENSEHIDSRGNGNENAKSDEEGWQVVHKKVYAKKIQENGNELSNGSEPTTGKGDVNGKISMTNGNANGNGNGRGGKKKGSGRYRGRGKGSVGNGNHDNENRDKDLSNGGNGDVVDAGNSEGDAAVTVESLNDKESGGKETTEEVKSDIPKPEETAEEREERLRKEQREERRRLRIQEAAEEARKMTLDQYEALLKKKQALNLKKTEARRVVSTDEDFENMKEVGKKLDNDETLIVEKEKTKGKAALVKSTSESKLKKSKSFEKGPKPLAANLAKLFRPASFRSHRSRRGRDHENQVGFAHRLPSQNGSTSEDLPSNNGPLDEKVLKDEIQFPVLGSVPPALPSESSAPPANPSTSSESSSAPPSNPSTSSGC